MQDMYLSMRNVRYSYMHDVRISCAMFANREQCAQYVHNMWKSCRIYDNLLQYVQILKIYANHAHAQLYAD